MVDEPYACLFMVETPLKTSSYERPTRFECTKTTAPRKSLKNCTCVPNTLYIVDKVQSEY